MFNLKDYVGVHHDSPDWTPARQANAVRLIEACAKLQSIMEADGVKFYLNPATGTTISGQTMGGFRPQCCTQGAPLSSHKEAFAVDRYDPDNHIDDWIMAHQSVLVECGIYIEHPDSTEHWSHWSLRAPKSGLHVFHP
jgi:hypothetical protein